MNPVCGSNNVTYNNLCLFGFAQCDNATLTMTAVGSCDAPRLECPSVCEEIFSPVCGSDGITYANKFEYRRGKCANLALEMVNPLGPCDESQPVESDCSVVACISVWDPVCGSDGKTYSNACELDIAKCKQGSTTLQIAHKGDCAVHRRRPSQEAV
ncbi:hypothetical protein Ae201684P_021042 [Aphanomyces euteiches]|uniref:Kazal-like domain-containing protein n=1 Tax=Aphanomyces euteiches TaxID=100861 RepID=A0A6G0WX33_9STRA|nr:hypothetical protein Ae201684_010787 [Aphanomyces euteiches]KAH9061707.1 hypothetical protein Ae201684P_021042 [Aphanomyces euteiches]